MQVTIHSEPVGQTRTLSVCQWVTERGIPLIIERTHYSGGIGGTGGLELLALGHWNHRSTSYWLVEQSYTDEKLGQAEAEQFHFTLLPDPYTNGTWFPCFRDWDLCIAFLDSKTGNKHVGE